MQTAEIEAEKKRAIKLEKKLKEDNTKRRKTKELKKKIYLDVTVAIV